MTYKELTEKMSKENLSQMEGSDEMLRSAEGADMELSIDDLGLIAGGIGGATGNFSSESDLPMSSSDENGRLRCSVCGQLDYIVADRSQFKEYKCYNCRLEEYNKLLYQL